MNVFKIEGKPKSPHIILDKENNILEFAGRFIPQNTKEFFEPVFEWFNEYLKNPREITRITFRFDYFNTSSSKKFLDLFTLLEEVHNKTTEVQIVWYYMQNDDDIFEAGKGYKELVDIPFSFESYK